MNLPNSRGFWSALAGIAITIYSWFSPWVLPGLPAILVLDSLKNYSEFSFNVRAVIFFGLIVLNVSVWAVITYSLSLLGSRVFRSRGVDKSISG
jgi:hypothetical protein